MIEPSSFLKTTSTPGKGLPTPMHLSSIGHLVGELVMTVLASVMPYEEHNEMPNSFSMFKNCSLVYPPPAKTPYLSEEISRGFLCCASINMKKNVGTLPIALQ